MIGNAVIEILNFKDLVDSKSILACLINLSGEQITLKNFEESSSSIYFLYIICTSSGFQNYSWLAYIYVLSK